jgi:hypothetical protein
LQTSGSKTPIKKNHKNKNALLALLAAGTLLFSGGASFFSVVPAAFASEVQQADCKYYGDPDFGEAPFCIPEEEYDYRNCDGHHDSDQTWINWVKDPSGKKIPNGGTTTSDTVIVDFQGKVSGKGSHIDLALDGGRYKPVASPYKITGLWDGIDEDIVAAGHTICLRSVDKYGNVDPTPAMFSFTVFREDNNNNDAVYKTLPDYLIVKEVEDDVNVKEVEDNLNVKEVEDDVNVKEVEDDLNVKEVEDDVNVNKVEDDVNIKEVEDNVNIKEVEDDVNIKEADDVYFKDIQGDVIVNTVEDGKKTKQILENTDKILDDTKKIVNELDDESDEIKKVVNERADDIEKQISDLNDDGKLFKKISDQLKTLRNGQKDSKEDILDRLDKLEADLQRAIDLNEKALKEKIEDSEGDVKAKVEDSEDDIIKAISKQINALWDWLRDLVAELSKALGVAAKEEK